MFTILTAGSAFRRRTGAAFVALAVAATSLGTVPAVAFPGSAATPLAGERGPIVQVGDRDDWRWRRIHRDRDGSRWAYRNDRRWGDRDDRHWRYRDRDRWRRHRDRDDVAAGIAGLAAGAIIGGILGSGGGRVGAPVVSAPPAGGYAPFSAGYVSYCSSKYRSFDARTGTFMGYDGRRHFCR